jgi:hypothetical protein
MVIAAICPPRATIVGAMPARLASALRQNGQPKCRKNVSTNG